MDVSVRLISSGDRLPAPAPRWKGQCAQLTIATGIPAFWILMIALRPYLPTWLHPLLENVPAIWTIAVSLAIAGFQWRNLLYYQRKVIPLVQEMYERAMAKHDRELLTVLSNVLRIGKLKGFFRSLFPRSR